MASTDQWWPVIDVDVVALLFAKELLPLTGVCESDVYLQMRLNCVRSSLNHRLNYVTLLFVLPVIA